MSTDAPDAELVLLVRRPPGRGHLYRFAGARFTVGASGDLCLEGPGIAEVHLVFERTADGYVVRAADEATHNGHRLRPGQAQPVQTADAVELGDRLIEVAIERDPAPTTDRHDAGRLQRAQAAERRVRDADGPSLWVLRGAAAGLAVPVDAGGVTCGSGPDDGLILPDARVEPGHFTVRVEADGGLRLSARAPVRVRGRPMTDGRLTTGDLIFIGDTVCEVRAPPRPPAVDRVRWAALGLMALGLALLVAAWWVERG